MLIDRLDRKLLNENLMIGDAIDTIFYIDEGLLEFSKTMQYEGKVFGEMLLAQWLPYDSFILHFHDGFITYHVRECDNDGRRILSDSFVLGRGFVGRIIPDNSVVSYNFYGDSLCLSWVTCINQEFVERDVTVESVESRIDGARFFLQYFVLRSFLSLLSCKNIKSENKEPPVKLQKRRKKKNKPPLVSYRVLKLNNLQKKSSEKGDGGLWSNKVHFCRGHMREYSADRPLFGRLVGKYWIPPHARGSKKLGGVEKDYSIKTLSVRG